MDPFYRPDCPGEARFVNKIEASGTYLPKKFKCWQFPGSCLAGAWDSFYENLSEDKIEFENKSDSATKKKAQLHCAIGNPRITMQILDASKNNNQFDGVTVKGSLPELFHGMDFAYFIQDDRFCKAEPDFMEKAKPLSDLSRNGQFHFQMGRNTY